MTSRQVNELYLVRAQQLKRENLLIGKLGAAIVNARGEKADYAGAVSGHRA